MRRVIHSKKLDPQRENMKTLIENNISSDKYLETNIFNIIPLNCNMHKDIFEINTFNHLPPLFNLFNKQTKRKEDLRPKKGSPIIRNESNRLKSTHHKLPTLSKQNRTFSTIQRKIKPNSKHLFDSFDLIKAKHHICAMLTIPMKNLLTHPHHVFSFFVNRTYSKQIPLYMKHRINWKLVEKKSEGYNFRWKYYAKRINWTDYKHDPKQPQEKLKMLNLFENYNEIGNKMKLFINMAKYCAKHNLNVFQYIPFTVVLTKQKSAMSNIESLGSMLEYTSDPQTLARANKSNGVLTSTPYSNYFKLDKNYGTSFLELPLIYFPSTFLSKQNNWILKPVDLYQGLGVKISNSIEEIEKHAHFLFTGMEKITSEQEEWYKSHPEAKKKKKKQYRAESIVIQKYLDSPLLFYKRKFDLRCFVLVDHCLNVHICREGYLKACSEEYDLASDNQFAHITNYSLQKKSEYFSRYEQSNEISYKQLRTSLNDLGSDPGVYDSIMKEIRDLVELSMNCVGRKLKRDQQTLSFQIFGYDFIIDSKYKPWILEINYNPGLEISSELIGRIIPRMVDDAFRLTIDTVFDTVYDDRCYSLTNRAEYKSIYPLEGYDDKDNIFEFVCNLNRE